LEEEDEESDHEADEFNKSNYQSKDIDLTNICKSPINFK